MKKIFAIALAVVMVLSMASAFALSDCFGNFAWPCDSTTYCGRGSVEIVPFVRTNSACGYSLQISECAATTPGLPIFFAVRLNVEANPDAEANENALKPQQAYWWDSTWTADTSDVNDPGATGVVVTFKKVIDTTTSAAAVKIDLPITSDPSDTTTAKIDWDADKAKSYYYDHVNSEWINVEDVEDLDDVVYSIYSADPTVDASKVEVCAELYSKHNGQGVWYYGDYKVDSSTLNTLVVEKGSSKVTYTIDPATGEETVVSNPKDFAAEVSKLFNMANCTLGTCLTEKNIAKNFGWDTDHELKDCFKWAGATAIVDSDCVVAIPKTGDASLLAWLF